MTHTTIILAGGRSFRMGANKALVPFRGKPLIQYSIDLAHTFSNKILISSNVHDLDHLGYPVVGDILPLKAPLAGIHAGLAGSLTDWNLVLTCDMPNVTGDIVSRLMERLDNTQKMVVPHHDGFAEPLCGFYHRSLVSGIEINFSEGKYSPLDLAESAPAAFVSMDDLPAAARELIFRNMNDRKDLLL